MDIAQCMTRDPVTVRPEETLAVAQEKMARGRFRRLPVVDASGHLLGIITDGDLRQHVGYLPTTRVTAAMIEKTITVGPDASIESAAELMLQHQIGGLPVVAADGRVAGIVTESDLLRVLLAMLRGAAPERKGAS